MRDLVDLVVFARTQRIDGTELIEAITAEWTNRDLPGSPFFAPPARWNRLYPAEARRVPACREILTFDAAVELVKALLTPTFDGTGVGRHWSPEAGAWTDTKTQGL